MNSVASHITLKRQQPPKPTFPSQSAVIMATMPAFRDTFICYAYFTPPPPPREDVTFLSEDRVASILPLSRFAPLLSPSLLVLAMFPGLMLNS